MRLVIVEDDSLLRDNLSLLLREEKDFDVVGAFGSAEEALKNLKPLSPDLMLVDLGLPGMPGIELIREAKGAAPEIEIMAHTIYEDKDTVFSAIKAGASGYLLKGSTPREIIEALRNLRQGGAPMSPKIARKVISEFQQGDIINDQYILSAREKAILREIEKGMTYKEIADRFNISPHTVHTHIKNTYEKLHAKDRKEALVTARKKGII
jgi:two-component system, NarL family, response regulator